MKAKIMHFRIEDPHTLVQTVDLLDMAPQYTGRLFLVAHASKPQTFMSFVSAEHVEDRYEITFDISRNADDAPNVQNVHRGTIKLIAVKKEERDLLQKLIYRTVFSERWTMYCCFTSLADVLNSRKVTSYRHNG